MILREECHYSAYALTWGLAPKSEPVPCQNSSSSSRLGFHVIVSRPEEAPRVLVAVDCAFGQQRICCAATGAERCPAHSRSAVMRRTGRPVADLGGRGALGGEQRPVAGFGFAPWCQARATSIQ